MSYTALVIAVIALVLAVAGLYISIASAFNARAGVHFNRATDLYLARQRTAGDAEMEHGRKLGRRADRMVFHMFSRISKGEHQ